jgi:hypothetical protein
MADDGTCNEICMPGREDAPDSHAAMPTTCQLDGGRYDVMMRWLQDNVLALRPAGSVQAQWTE